MALISWTEIEGRELQKKQSEQQDTKATKITILMVQVPGDVS
jgi:hypothetical protein